MNKAYWQLKAGGNNYYDSFRYCTRIQNRSKALTRDNLHDPFLDQQLALAMGVKKASAAELVRMYKDTAPKAIRRFQEQTIGLGDAWIAMLIGVVGDFKEYTEAWWEEDPTGEEKRVLVTGETRTCGVREIWTYCGVGDPARKHKRGQDQQEALGCGNPLAKMIIHIIAKTALRNNGVPGVRKRVENHQENCACKRCARAGEEIPRSMTPYYPKYLQWKEQAAAQHPDWTKKHVDNHAVRKVGKAILKDIWRVQHGVEPVYGARTPWTRRDIVAA